MKADDELIRKRALELAVESFGQDRPKTKDVVDRATAFYDFLADVKVSGEPTQPIYVGPQSVGAAAGMEADVSVPRDLPTSHPSDHYPLV